MVLPTMQSFTNSTPIFRKFSISASTILFGRRNSGIPYFRTPPISCKASNTVTEYPFLPYRPQKKVRKDQNHRSNFNAIGRFAFRKLAVSAFTFIIGGKTFQITNCNGFSSCFYMNTSCFTLFFLRTNATSHTAGSELVRFNVRAASPNSPRSMFFYKAGNIYANGTSFNTTGICAVQTACCFF